jgi:hypothetical protein
VKSSALPEFWECFNRLPPPVQKIARKNFLLWQKQPALKSLGSNESKTISGRFALVPDSVRWLRSMVTPIYGSGSGRTTNTSGC